MKSLPVDERSNTSGDNRNGSGRQNVEVGDAEDA
jgi:hypothetical protein